MQQINNNCQGVSLKHHVTDQMLQSNKNKLDFI